MSWPILFGIVLVLLPLAVAFVCAYVAHQNSGMAAPWWEPEENRWPTPEDSQVTKG